MTPKEASRIVQEVLLSEGEDKLTYSFKSLGNSNTESKVRTWAINPVMHDSSDLGKFWLDLNFAPLVRVAAPPSAEVEQRSDDEQEYTRGFRFNDGVYGFRKELRVRLGSEQQPRMKAIVEGVLESWLKQFNLDTSYVYNDMFSHCSQEDIVEGMRAMRDFQGYQYVQLSNKYQNPAPWMAYSLGDAEEMYLSANLAYPNATKLKVVDEKDRMYGTVEENGQVVYSEQGIQFSDLAQFRSFVCSEFLKERDFTWSVRALVFPMTISWRMGHNMADRSRPEGVPIVYPVIHWGVKGGVLCKRVPYDMGQSKEKDVLEDAVANFVFQVTAMKPVKKPRVVKTIKGDEEDEDSDADTLPLEDAKTGETTKGK